MQGQNMPDLGRPDWTAPTALGPPHSSYPIPVAWMASQLPLPSAGSTGVSLDPLCTIPPSRAVSPAVPQTVSSSHL